MRLIERTLIEAGLVPRMVQAGSLGGEAEVFSGEMIAFRAGRIPEGNELAAGERGAVHAERLRLLVAQDVPAKTGDGVRVEERLYRIVDIQRWTAHVELVCEAIV